MSDDELPEEVPGADDFDGTDDSLRTYEVSDWSGESRSLLDALLTSAGVRHFWQGTALSVAIESEIETDTIIEEVLATATVALDADRDKAVYEVGEWSSAMQTSLATSLLVAEIPYEWDEQGDLLVYSDDEEAVDAILDEMPDPDDGERALDVGVDVPGVLTSAWHAASQLVKDPVHSDAVVTVAEAADTLEHVKLPFGFEPSVWRNIVDRACALRDGLAGGDEPDDEPWTDDQVIEVAEVLRDAIRPFL